MHFPQSLSSLVQKQTLSVAVSALFYFIFLQFLCGLYISKTWTKVSVFTGKNLGIDGTYH